MQIVDGEYHLLKKNNIDETNTSVGTVTVAESENIIDAITLLNSVSTPGANIVIPKNNRKAKSTPKLAAWTKPS